MSAGRRIQNIYETPFEPYDMDGPVEDGQELPARQLDQGIRAWLLPDSHGAGVRDHSP